MPNQSKQFKSFKEFYPFYLSEHQNPVNRSLHFIGSCLIVFIGLIFIFTQTWWGLVFLPVIGYGFAWIGHYIFEQNKPATFTYPFYSFLGDWMMFWDILRGRIKINVE